MRRLHSTGKSTDKIYDNAIVLWLIRNDRNLLRLRNKGRKRSEQEVTKFVSDIKFGANDSWWLSEITYGGDAEPVISFKYRGRRYHHLLEDTPLGFFIQEVSEIVTELKERVKI